MCGPQFEKPESGERVATHIATSRETDVQVHPEDESRLLKTRSDSQNPIAAPSLRGSVAPSNIPSA